MMSLLQYIARHGRLVLVGGLTIGALFPDLAHEIRKFLAECAFLLLFVAALRIGYRDAMGKLEDLSRLLPALLLFQIAWPLGLMAIFHLAGFGGTLATALLIAASASSISGSPNLALMTGNNPAPAMRLLIVGTAILPLTVIPVFYFMPQFGSLSSVAFAAARLLLIIFTATLLAFILRHWWLRHPSPAQLSALDGVSAIFMAVLVVGLMSAIGPAIRHEPLHFLQVLIIAFIANIGTQLLAWFAMGKWVSKADRASYAITAGNRNNALFIAALPAAIMDPLLLFIGCYQIPMYLTPLLLGSVYRPKEKAITLGANEATTRPEKSP